MKHGNYTIKEFLTFHSLDQVLIPEIQRDYVWGVENVNQLLKSIVCDFQATSYMDEEESAQVLRNIPVAYAADFAKFIEAQKPVTNIGFLYAYFDPEQHTKYILIDGQQRLTTVFLILLYLYIREGRTQIFRKTYFQSGRPKVDYKVRQSAHDFFLHFIDYLLNNGDLDAVNSQYWFHSSFEHDVTISSLLANYKAIVGELDNQNLTASYIEDQVEFWYFDTAQSEQGEDLYLYMNSRGERVQANENVKAKLLEHISESEKHKWGSTWEEWQNFFWLNRGKSASADRGFDEFLKWIVVICEIQNPFFNESMDLSEQIRVITESEKLDVDTLSLELIESYFKAVGRLLEAGIDRYFSLSLFKEKPTQVTYVRVFPLLMYAVEYPDATLVELLRIARFFFNVTRFDLISKSPLRFAGQAIHLMRNLLADELRDATDLMRYRDEGKFEGIITDEELQKLFMYSALEDEQKRCAFEEMIWEAEDFEMCDGKVILLWNCMDFHPFRENKEDFDEEKFKAVFRAFRELFTKRNDRLRRALLCKGDYTLYDGTSTSINASRYSLGATRADWLKIFEKPASQQMVNTLLLDFMELDSKHSALSVSQKLNLIIGHYVEMGDKTSWRYHFIAEREVMKYCKAKLFCYAGEELNEVTLLQSKKATENSYIRLDHFLSNRA